MSLRPPHQSIFRPGKTCKPANHVCVNLFKSALEVRGRDKTILLKSLEDLLIYFTIKE